MKSYFINKFVIKEQDKKLINNYLSGEPIFINFNIDLKNMLFEDLKIAVANYLAINFYEKEEENILINFINNKNIQKIDKQEILMNIRIMLYNEYLIYLQKQSVKNIPNYLPLLNIIKKEIMIMKNDKENLINEELFRPIKLIDIEYKYLSELNTNIDRYKDFLLKKNIYINNLFNKKENLLIEIKKSNSNILDILPFLSIHLREIKTEKDFIEKLQDFEKNEKITFFKRDIVLKILKEKKINIYNVNKSNDKYLNIVLSKPIFQKYMIDNQIKKVKPNNFNKTNKI